MSQIESLRAHVPGEYAGWRLDRALACIFPQYSRARIQHWIRAGEVTLNQGKASTRLRLQGGEQVCLRACFKQEPPWMAQNIPLCVVHEDEELLIIDKPAGLIVHPGAGNPTHTLLNALLYHDPRLSAVPRAGIVHRLDKDTSGLMAIAKTIKAYAFLVARLKERVIRREYLALVKGILSAAQGSIGTGVGRHPVLRRKMAVREDGKPALTHYRTLRHWRTHSLLQIRLETGRTHQIRVHLAHLGHPVAGDSLYGAARTAGSGTDRELSAAIGRQMLHACQLELPHPAHGSRFHYGSKTPDDMQYALDILDRESTRDAAMGNPVRASQAHSTSRACSRAASRSVSPTVIKQE